MAATADAARAYIGQSASSLITAIGSPISSSYAPSCLGPGEDGELVYDGLHRVHLPGETAWRRWRTCCKRKPLGGSSVPVRMIVDRAAASEIEGERYAETMDRFDFGGADAGHHLLWPDGPAPGGRVRLRARPPGPPPASSSQVEEEPEPCEGAPRPGRRAARWSTCRTTTTVWSCPFRGPPATPRWSCPCGPTRPTREAAATAVEEWEKAEEERKRLEEEQKRLEEERARAEAEAAAQAQAQGETSSPSASSSASAAPAEQTTPAPDASGGGETAPAAGGDGDGAVPGGDKLRPDGNRPGPARRNSRRPETPRRPGARPRRLRPIRRTPPVLLRLLPRSPQTPAETEPVEEEEPPHPHRRGPGPGGPPEPPSRCSGRRGAGGRWR